MTTKLTLVLMLLAVCLSGCSGSDQVVGTEPVPTERVTCPAVKVGDLVAYTGPDGGREPMATVLADRYNCRLDLLAGKYGLKRYVSYSAKPIPNTWAR